MSSVNKVFLLGNLGTDPEVKFTASGVAVTNFTLATSSWVKGEDKTEWHRIVAFDKTAELAGKYLRKGSQAHIEGRLQTRSWEDKEGNKKYTTEIVADRVTFVGGKSGGADAEEAF